jgi:two-component system chemotaxis response regulator CheY
MTIPANISLLVVDDQKSIRTLVKECLKGLGYTRISECEDGAQALRHLETYTVHMVISDLNMPNMTGLDLLAAVRTSARLKHLGFLMLTSRGEVELVRQAVALGVNNYLTKPFTMGDLKKKIESVIGKVG